MNIPQEILEPFGYTGMPILTITGNLGAYLQLVAIDWELKKLWDRRNSTIRSLARRKQLTLIKVMAKTYGARIVHTYTTKNYIMVHYKVNKEWGVTRLRT